MTRNLSFRMICPPNYCRFFFKSFSFTPVGYVFVCDWTTDRLTCNCLVSTVTRRYSPWNTTNKKCSVIKWVHTQKHMQKLSQKRSFRNYKKYWIFSVWSITDNPYLKMKKLSRNRSYVYLRNNKMILTCCTTRVQLTCYKFLS